MVAGDIEVFAICDDIDASSEALEEVGLVMTIVGVDTGVDERAMLHEHNTVRS
jgi:hypothetical protein